MKRDDHQLIQQVLDGDATPDMFEGFQQRLRAEPELMELYGQYAMLYHSLSEEFEGGENPGVAMEHSRSRFFGISPWIVLPAVAALFGLAIWLKPWAALETTEDVAVATFSVDAVWRIDGSTRNLGGATAVSRGGVLNLEQGRAAISLEPSVTAVIEGPAELEFLSEFSVKLSKGRGFFHRGGTGGGLTVETPKLTAVDSGTEFGIQVNSEMPDELQVIQGKVHLVSTGGKESFDLSAGEAARVPSVGSAVRFAADGKSFARSLGRFLTVVSGPFVREQWRVAFGNPSVTGTRIEGANFAAYLKLPQPEPAGEGSVLLATVDVGKAPGGDFHTDGWAGMSFFSGSKEIVFFGDSFGPKPTWSLDVKQRSPVILPEHPVTGPRKVTFRYEARTGDVSLHEGGLPLKSAFCRGKLPVGTKFDEIRIGASAGAAIAVNSLVIRVGS